MTGPVARFRARITDALGLSFPSDRDAWLAEVLRARATASSRSVEAYLDQPFGGEEIRELSRALTVGESYFFRAAEQLRVFVATCLKAQKPPARPVRVLSAGCASGEEAYSIAIAVRESGVGSGTNAKVEILAIDVDAAALARARDGVYSAWSLRETPDDLQRRWFSRRNERFEVAAELKSAVVFEERNLVGDRGGFWSAGASSFDAVYCRNVLMYFDRAAASGVLRRLATVLRPGGLLFLGHAESIRGLSDDFELCHVGDAFYYLRRGELRAAPEPTADPGVDLAADPEGRWVDSIRRSAARIEELGSRIHGAASATDAAQVRPEANVARAFELFAHERFAEARTVLEALPADVRSASDVALLRAVLMTHGAELSSARAVCSNLLTRGRASASAHYLIALCDEAAGDATAATEHAARASELDGSFGLPQLHLGRLARRAGRPAEARSHFERALVLLEREDPARLLLFGGGFTRETLLALCRGELAACEEARR